MTSPSDRTQSVRDHYIHILEEIVYGVDTLENSQPLTRMSSMLMEHEKNETLRQIAYLQDFLEAERSKVEAVSTIPVWITTRSEEEGA